MNSIFYNNLVFGKTLESARRKLDSILNSIPDGEVKEVRKNQHEYRIKLQDGTRYQVVSATQSARGYRCDKAYIEYGIDWEIIDCVIKPMLCVSKLDSKEQIEWF